MAAMFTITLFPSNSVRKKRDIFWHKFRRAWYSESSGICDKYIIWRRRSQILLKILASKNDCSKSVKSRETRNFAGTPRTWSDISCWKLQVYRRCKQVILSTLCKQRMEIAYRKSMFGSRVITPWILYTLYTYRMYHCAWNWMLLKRSEPFTT